MKYLIAGLGNIGAEYKNTRHNIGFQILDALAGASNILFSDKRYGFVGEYKFKARNLILLKPSTYMNLSGKAVAYWLNELKIPKENLLVVVDDIALPFGSLRLRTKGSSAGHNGLKDIEQSLGGQDYSRLRVGIGGEFAKGQQVDYVLSNFSKDEFEKMPSIISKANEMIVSYCLAGPAITMSQFND